MSTICFVVASNLVSLCDPFLGARVSSLFVVESNLSSHFIVFPTLCGHATRILLLSALRKGPVFNVAIWESMAEHTRCARVRKASATRP